MTGQTYTQNGIDLGSTLAVYRNGVVSVEPRPGQPSSINNHGDFVTNGEMVYGRYSTQAGGTLRRADGTSMKLPLPDGYAWLNARSINDAGVIVGHFSAFSPSPSEFSWGRPYYYRNGQYSIPGDVGTMYKVNNKGNALAAYDSPEKVGIWSPERGMTRIPGFQVSDLWLENFDFNDNDEVLQEGADATGVYAHILSPTGSRKVFYPMYPGSGTRGGTSGGINNLGNITSYLRLKDPDGVFRQHWSIFDNGSWVDVTNIVLQAMPAGSSLLTLGDIDDYKRAYGIVQLADGSQTIVQVNMVPEPATLGALGLGFAALLRRGKKRGNEAFTP